jgi:hypothetical protein
MNMVRIITSVTLVMNFFLKHDKGKKIHMPKKYYHE